MKAVELINKALVLSGIIARDLEQVGGSEGEDGLFWLNQILSEQAITGRYLPYYSHIELNCVIGQELYFIPNLVSIDAITFNIGPVRFPMVFDALKKYFGSPRVDNIESLPAHYFYERTNGGVNLYLYFLPSDTYLLKITGNKYLSSVTFDDELADQFDSFYQSFLIFELAKRLCDWYKITMPPQNMETLERLRRQLINLNPRDLSIQKISMLDKKGGLNWGQVNLGRGWTIP